MQFEFQRKARRQAAFTTRIIRTDQFAGLICNTKIQGLPGRIKQIDGQVLKEKGELLSLTATEAMTLYGDPPEPLLGAGIAENIDDPAAREKWSGVTASMRAAG